MLKICLLQLKNLVKNFLNFINSSIGYGNNKTQTFFYLICTYPLPVNKITRHLRSENPHFTCLLNSSPVVQTLEIFHILMYLKVKLSFNKSVILNSWKV